MKLLITESLSPSQLEEVRLIAREHLVVATQERDIALAEAVAADMAMVSAFAREGVETAEQLKWVYIPWAGRGQPAGCHPKDARWRHLRQRGL